MYMANGATVSSLSTNNNIDGTGLSDLATEAPVHPIILSGRNVLRRRVCSRVSQFCE